MITGRGGEAAAPLRFQGSPRVYCHGADTAQASVLDPVSRGGGMEEVG